MARFWTCALAWAAVTGGARGGGVELREAPAVGSTSRVFLEMKASGTYRTKSSPAAAKAASTKPLPMKVESRLEFDERVLKVGEDGRASRTARRLRDAVAAIGEARPALIEARTEVALLLAERRDSGPVVVCPGGPLTRPELDLLQGPGDPLALPGLLPTSAVAEGDRWKVSDEAARSLSDYDKITSNGLEAKLESLDDDRAKVRLGGEVKGSARGGEGTITFTGRMVFDRRTSRITRVELSRTESREAGPVELGFDVKSTLNIERSPVEVPPGLADAVVEALPKDSDPRREWLLLAPSGARYSLEHDRDWHQTADEPRQVVLRRIEGGGLVAQCNLVVGPSAGKGRHQDPESFRDDIRKALGPRFVAFLGAGEVEGPDESSYSYKVAVQGREGDLGVLWYYYLMAGPEGDQLLATFTLELGAEKAFAGEDPRMLGTLRWKGPDARPRQ